MAPFWPICSVAPTMPIASRLDNVAEARRLARRVLPRALFDYIDGGAEDEVTMGENERALRQIAFRPRMGTKVQRPRLDTTVLGRSVSLPVLLAPCGLVEMVHPDGAIGVARAARRAGTVSVLSTVAGTPPAALSDEPGPRWFQLYAAGRDEADDLMGQASSAGFEGLVVTIDTPALGLRDRDVRNGVGGPIRLGARSALRLRTADRGAPGMEPADAAADAVDGRRHSGGSPRARRPWGSRPWPCWRHRSAGTTLPGSAVAGPAPW